MQTALLTLLVSLLHVRAAHALPYDITNCDDEQQMMITAAVDGALQKLTQVDDLARTDLALLTVAFTNAFGDYRGSPDEFEARLIFALHHTNIRPLLNHTPGVALSGNPPMWPRVTFNCTLSNAAGHDVARRIKTGRFGIDIYPVFFDDNECPHSGSYENSEIKASRVGTILHEAIHLVNGGDDVYITSKSSQENSAANLALDKDPRALSNAENYERFYMSPPLF